MRMELRQCGPWRQTPKQNNANYDNPNKRGPHCRCMNCTQDADENDLTVHRHETRYCGINTELFTQKHIPDTVRSELKILSPELQLSFLSF